MAKPKSKCTVVGCDCWAYGRGCCLKHYKRLVRNGDPLKVQRVAAGTWNGKGCSVDGCLRSVRCRGMCDMHYALSARNGAPVRVRIQNGCRTSESDARLSRARIARYGKTEYGRLMRTVRAAERAALEPADVDYVDLLLVEAVRCGLCFAPLGADRTLDHVFPVSRGGGNENTNLQVLHKACNSRKRDRLIARLP